MGGAGGLHFEALFPLPFVKPVEPLGVLRGGQHVRIGDLNAAPHRHQHEEVQGVGARDGDGEVVEAGKFLGVVRVTVMLIWRDTPWALRCLNPARARSKFPAPRKRSWVAATAPSREMLTRATPALWMSRAFRR